jgi:hypothetical protein
VRKTTGRYECGSASGCSGARHFCVDGYILLRRPIPQDRDELPIPFPLRRSTSPRFVELKPSQSSFYGITAVTLLTRYRWRSTRPCRLSQMSRSGELSHCGARS